MCSNVTAGLAGLNMVYEAAGMHASLLGFCHESLIMGDDIIGQAMRCVRGIEVNDETLALDQMADVTMNGTRPLSGHRPNPQPDANGLRLSQNGRPDIPQGVGRTGQARPRRQGNGTQRGNLGLPPRGTA